MREVIFVEWWQKAVFYQIYPRSFMDSNGDGIGDIRGIIEKLDHLNDGSAQSLGIDAIWFSPFFVSPQKDFGYDIADYCQIDPSYGTLEDFDELVRECHKREIRVMLDLVVNHTSDQHPWFLESRSSRDNPKRDWYIWRDGKGKRPPNNWRSIFSGLAWEWDEHTGQWYLHSFLAEQADLNWANPEVRAAIHDVIRFWLNRGADGYRLDVAHAYGKDRQFRNNPPIWKRPPLDKQRMKDKAFFDKTIARFGLPDLQYKKFNLHQPETHEILREFRSVFNEFPGTTSIGEVMADFPEIAVSYYGKGDELHMNFEFDFVECPWDAGAFRRCVERWLSLLPPGSWPAWTLSNHDRIRAISRFGKSGQEDSQAKLLAMLLLTLPGTPFVYYGEEIGMKDPRLPKDLIQDPVGLKLWPFHKGRDSQRTPMQWDPSETAGFTPGRPWLPVGPELDTRNVVTQGVDPFSLLSFWRNMIWLRKKRPVLLEGTYQATTEGIPADCYVFSRSLGQQRLMVCLNFSNRTRKINLPGEGVPVFSTHNLRNKKPTKSITLSALEGCLVEI